MRPTTRFFAVFTALVVAVFVSFPVSSFAEDGERYSKIVDYKFVAEYAVIPVRDDVAIIDARPYKRRYNKGHIPGAISIPNSGFDKMTDMLPEDKGKLIIFYCGGQKCMLSHKSAFKAEKLGYTNIRVYADGYPDWIKQGNFGSVDAPYVKDVIAKNTATVIDARPFKRKYAKGHVPGAISIPNTRFDKQANMLPADKKSPLIFYCGGVKCPLSVKSATKAKGMGYTNVMVFQAGFPAWKKAGFPVAKGAEPFEAKAGGAAIKAGPDGDTITVASFSKIMKDDPGSIYLYDVRDPGEYDKGSIPGAKNMPVEDLEDEIDSLPTDKPIVFVCATGARSGEAYDIVKLLKEDMKVFFLDAEITYHGDGKYDLKQN